jgi:hypothetical protein
MQTLYQDQNDWQPGVFFGNVLQVYEFYLLSAASEGKIDTEPVDNALAIYHDMWKDFSVYLLAKNDDIRNYEFKSPEVLEAEMQKIYNEVESNGRD